MGWLLLFSRLLLRLDEWMESEVRGIGYGSWNLGEFGSIAIATKSLEASISSACTGNRSRSLCLGARERSPTQFLCVGHQRCRLPCGKGVIVNSALGWGGGDSVMYLFVSDEEGSCGWIIFLSAGK
jgi:hypothetical protein